MAKETGETKESASVKDGKKEKVIIKPEDVAKALTDKGPDKEPLENKRIYVGPGRPGLITNTVYNGDFPIFVAKMIKDCPSIEKLMVKIPDYTKARENVSKKGTIESRHAQKVIDYFNGKEVKA